MSGSNFVVGSNLVKNVEDFGKNVFSGWIRPDGGKYRIKIHYLKADFMGYLMVQKF